MTQASVEGVAVAGDKLEPLSVLLPDVHQRTRWGWHRGEGVMGRKLKAVRRGRVWYSTRQWVFEFLAAINATG